ncbi:MAG: BlaI/MecI/CopY family transcriptional regulator [Planctomycetota bacterium]|jgi:predicted transcriptional regulator
MARVPADHPTELELLILKVLWQQAPLPVREIRKRLAEQGRDLAHTSVITTLNTMFQKRQLRRRKRGNAFLFSPRVDRGEVSRKMLGDIVDRVFDGSASAVMLSLFDCSEIDDDDVKELRRLFNRKVKEQRP